MTVSISERSFEEHIETALVGNVAAGRTIREPGPAYDFGGAPGGYLRRRHTDYDRALCLLPNDVYDFIAATQPEAWDRLRQHHKEDTRKRFLAKLSREIARRGTLDVLRNGIRDNLVRELEKEGWAEMVLDAFEGGPVLSAGTIAPARYLPKARRQHGYAALMALAADMGMTVSVSGLSNPDFQTPRRQEAAPAARQRLLPNF